MIGTWSRLPLIDSCIANDHARQCVTLVLPASRWSASLIGYTSLNRATPSGFACERSSHPRVAQRSFHSRCSTLGCLRVVPSGLEQEQARSNPLDGRKLNTPVGSVTYHGGGCFLRKCTMFLKYGNKLATGYNGSSALSWTRSVRAQLRQATFLRVNTPREPRYERSRSTLVDLFCRHGRDWAVVRPTIRVALGRAGRRLAVTLLACQIICRSSPIVCSCRDKHGWRVG